MVHSSHRDELARLTEQLVEIEEDHVRERLLLETIVGTGWAQAATLFRRSTLHPAWIPVLSRGPADLLPGADLVDAIDRGAFPRELPLSGSVLFAGGEERAVALALGGAADEQVAEELETLLEVMALLAAEPSRTADLLHPPLPESETEEPGRADDDAHLRRLEDEERDETAA